ncbi:anti-sigma factor antagonist [Thiospirochaeta perfilievii]|uniref:Anti-sigma factor antagonist n=1 Tax=Thiospirochaeta perfilievii TaxID=252967 RepID=A0A5C1QEX2_9SPIO|nr:STAS domain-containing protein [Thiospirochaeta perfilievii]QEN04772.1 anti-sigma factor antagonist [Thiospirochaeta perfilievii]
MSNDSIVQGFDLEKDDSLKINLHVRDEALVLYLTGYIDTYNSNLFQKRIVKAVNAGFNKLIFQCGGLNYVSSTGIGSFTAFLKLVKGKNGDLVLIDVQPKVFEVFQLLGFSKFFNIKRNLDEAIEFFSNTGSSAAEKTIFPKIFKCPICSKKLKASKSGRFRCSECKTILAIDKTGQVFLG